MSSVVYDPGVEKLMSMAGEHGVKRDTRQEAEDASKQFNIDVAEPFEKSATTWSVAYTCKWGIRRFRFQDEFVIEDNKIQKLKRTQL